VDENPTFKDLWTAEPDPVHIADLPSWTQPPRVPPDTVSRWHVPLWNRVGFTTAIIPFVAFGLWINSAMIYWYSTQTDVSLWAVLFYLVGAGVPAIVLVVLDCRLLWARLTADEVGLTVRNGRSVAVAWPRVAELVPGAKFMTIERSDGADPVRCFVGGEKFGSLRQWGQSAQIAHEVSYVAGMYGHDIPVADYPAGEDQPVGALDRFTLRNDQFTLPNE